MMIAAVMISGCGKVSEGFDMAKDFTFDRAADVTDEICGRGDGVRMDSMDEVNSRAEIGYWTSTDCDRDGQPDFQIDPTTGLVIR